MVRRSFILGIIATVVGYLISNHESHWDFTIADYNNDNVPDIWVINRVGDGQTDVYVLSGATLGDWFLQSESDLHETDGNWEFNDGGCNA